MRLDVVCLYEQPVLCVYSVCVCGWVYVCMWVCVGVRVCGCMWVYVCVLQLAVDFIYCLVLIEVLKQVCKQQLN